MPASRAYSACTAELTGARPLRIVGVFRGELGQQDMALRKIVGGGRAGRAEPVDQSRTLRRHDHVAGVKVGMAQHVIGREVLDQREDAGDDALRKHVPPELRNQASIASRSESASGGGGVL